MSTLSRLVGSTLLTLPLAGVAAAQPPQILNGQVAAQPAGSPFVESFRAVVASQAEVTWIGYDVPRVEGRHTMCCSAAGSSGHDSAGSACCDACRLERDAGSPTRRESSPGPPAPVKLEGAERLVVFYRLADRAVDRIRVFSAGCPLDAGGRPVRWLEQVRAADSVALLESLTAVPASPDRRVPEDAIVAIALHADPAADAALERLATPTQPGALRKQISFWLGTSRGRRGFDLLQRLIRDDPSVEVRRGAIFGLSRSGVPEASAALFEVARANPEPRLRSEALFWIAQKAGDRAAAAIAERIDGDPDAEVKKKAVFALSQLPAGEGVPLLITVARTNANPEVRRQAMFWLGQSRDPRALDFFADVLK